MKYIDLYTSLVEVNSLLPNPQEDIADRISNIEGKLDWDSSGKTSEDIVCSYYKGLSSAIYGLIDKIRDRVDDLDKISEHQGNSEGITNASKARVLLLGETSAGKTTFLQRMFGEPCGKTGPTPITAFTVIHKITNGKSYLEMLFKNGFEVSDDNKEDFDHFLKKYKLFDGFDIIDGKLYNTEEEFSMDDKDEFLNFIYEANQYPFAFDEITWHHKKSNKQIKFLDYADIYDMPGSGGQVEHTENLESALKRYGDRIDVILYLIKSDQGIPSSYDVLKRLRDNLIQFSSKPELFFVYQICSPTKFNDLTDNLGIFIRKGDDTDAIEPFSQIEQEYFLKAHVLDARGETKDQIMANVALSSVLQQLYAKKTEELLNSVFVSRQPKEYDVMKPGTAKNGAINSKITDFFDGWAQKRGTDGKLPTIQKVKESFMKKFGLEDEHDISNLPNDLKVTLKKMRNSIESDINDIFDELKDQSNPLDILSRLNKQKNDSSDNKEKFNISAYVESFTDKYGRNENWQSLIYYIQAYHWLRLNYSGNTIMDIYASVSADPVKAYLKEYKDRLMRIRNVIPVLSSLSNSSNSR